MCLFIPLRNLPTRCPYIETYPQAWYFALKAMCKLIRDAQNGVISVWPYTALVDSVWGVFGESALASRPRLGGSSHFPSCSL